MVIEPAEFDEVVSPGEGGPIQAAIDRCREGGAILLQPGTYDLSKFVHVGKEVHVFGRGLARLRPVECAGIACTAAAATLDGLVVERTRGQKKFIGIEISFGRARLQHTLITGAFKTGCSIMGGADPVIVACRCAHGHSYWSWAAPRS